ncbi:unnamed protein product [Phytophthora fragariaefolia]|uniref:Unnamed protein product n=1 Tax=Phytophthora fragariaefolia TaxID=1490495 RepID=A0A9W6YRB1_9STRA|nr:unnamed protein product [Phytophthora fragariaefolia]
MLQSTRTLVEDYRATTFEFDLKVLTTLEHDATRLAKIQDLRGRYTPDRSRWFFSFGWTCSTEEQAEVERPVIRWSIILGSMKWLKRLDLVDIPILRVPEIIRSASTYCRYLESLLLPRPSGFYDPDGRLEMENLASALLEAIQRWYSKGYCGGLRQLTVPYYPEEDLFRHSTELFHSIVKYCPGIEYLDVCDSNNTGTEPLRGDKWSMTLETWNMFNASCSSLKQFSFAVVPFADPFFRVFGEHVKPQLKAYLCRQIQPGITNSIFEILTGCPALTTLVIQIDLYRNEDPQYGENYVNTNVYGDEFWETVAIYCPLLESIEMIDSSYWCRNKVWPIQNLTGRTLLALADLKSLSRITLPPSRLTGKDIFEYVRRVSRIQDEAETQRVINLSIGGYIRYPIHSFYSETIALLTLLSEETEDSLGAASCRQSPIINVWNPYISNAHGIRLRVYFSNVLQPTLNAVQASHPSLGLSVYILGRNGTMFDRIDKITLNWRHVHLPVFVDIDND